MERLVHLPFVHTFSTSCSSSISRSSISRLLLPPLPSPPPSPSPSPSPRHRHRRKSLSISLFASLFIRPNPKPGESSVGDRTAGLAGRQSQLRSWFKVGARTKYTPPVASGTNTYINRAPFLTTPKTRRRGIVLYPRILSKLLRGLTPGFISRTFHCGIKGRGGEKTVGIVQSDMALLNFSLSWKRSRINAMD